MRSPPSLCGAGPAGFLADALEAFLDPFGVMESYVAVEGNLPRVGHIGNKTPKAEQARSGSTSLRQDENLEADSSHPSEGGGVLGPRLPQKQAQQWKSTHPALARICSPHHSGELAIASPMCR